MATRPAISSGTPAGRHQSPPLSIRAGNLTRRSGQVDELEGELRPDVAAGGAAHPGAAGGRRALLIRDRHELDGRSLGVTLRARAMTLLGHQPPPPSARVGGSTLRKLCVGASWP